MRDKIGSASRALTDDFEAAKLLSPKRKTSQAETLEALADEQLEHFHIDPGSEFGAALRDAALRLYQAHTDVNTLWEVTVRTINELDRKDRVAYFNAKKFLCFQIAKVLDTLQNPFRKAYQSLELSDPSMSAKGPYPIFDNVSALFSASPVVVRTATYIYACTEWIDDAFRGKEFLLEIYSRLFNPTSIALANHIVDLEAGPYAADYMALNFNSGMASIDALFSSVLRRDDVVVSSRNVYGGTWQLLQEFFATDDKLAINLHWWDGHTAAEFEQFLTTVETEHRDLLDNGRRLFVYLESPCNPHGYVLDVPEICRIVHQRGHTVGLDGTVGTPFLVKPLQEQDEQRRPDYLIHSYTKDLTGTGATTAGVLIGKSHRMLLPKGESHAGVDWHDTIFWNVYFIKGAFLESGEAAHVLTGMKTLEVRMLQKCVNTTVLARFLASHPQLNVHCNVLEDDPNHALAQKVLRCGMPAALFTVDMESAELAASTFKEFFDCLAPVFDHEVSLGQSNTIVLCPAFTSHSELSEEALLESGILPTTIRIAVGDENPKELMAHFVTTAALTIDPVRPGFSDGFMGPDEVDRLVEETHLEIHRKYVEGSAKMSELLGTAVTQ